MMRLLDRAHDPDRIRLTFKKLLYARNDRSCSGTMSATGVRRDNQDLRDTLLLGHAVLCCCSGCFLFCCFYIPVLCFLCLFAANSSPQVAIPRAPLSPRPCAPSSSLFPVA